MSRWNGPFRDLSSGGTDLKFAKKKIAIYFWEGIFVLHPVPRKRLSFDRINNLYCKISYNIYDTLSRRLWRCLR